MRYGRHYMNCSVQIQGYLQRMIPKQTVQNYMNCSVQIQGYLQRMIPKQTVQNLFSLLSHIDSPQFFPFKTIWFSIFLRKKIIQSTDSHLGRPSSSLRGNVGSSRSSNITSFL